MPLYTTPMDNIIAAVAALANIDPTVDNTLEIAYAKNLLNCMGGCTPALQAARQHPPATVPSSLPPLQHRLPTSKNAPSRAGTAANQPQGQPRNDQLSYSSNEPPHY
jgi:hypothetical protein